MILSQFKKYSLGSFVLLIGLVISQASFAQPYACLPTCDITDVRNFVMAGPGQASFTDNRFAFGLSSPANSGSIEIGFFDGEDGTSTGGSFSDWDQGGASVIIFTLYADPTGEGAKDIMLGQWFGDGSAGNNTGNPMPDNDWFNVIIPNSPEAISANGNYRYALTAEIAPGVDAQSINSFRVRTDGSMIIFPFETFFFVSQVISPDDFLTAYPDLVFPDSINDPACFDLIEGDFACHAGEPGCCIANTTYDGSYTFYLDVAEGEGSIESWDGDFDYGSSPQGPPYFNCQPDFINVDVDDANTPNEVPEFAEGTDALPEGASSPTNPLDDSCNNGFLKVPSVFYSIISPDGSDVYRNDNPSGTEEWELFLITSEGGGDVDVGVIPGGIWRVVVEGLDLVNLNGFRINFPVIAVNDDGEPVDFDPPVRPIPTLNEWGLIALTSMFLILSVFYLRRKRVYN